MTTTSFVYGSNQHFLRTEPRSSPACMYKCSRAWVLVVTILHLSAEIKSAYFVKFVWRGVKLGVSTSCSATFWQLLVYFEQLFSFRATFCILSNFPSNSLILRYRSSFWCLIWSFFHISPYFSRQFNLWISCEKGAKLLETFWKISSNLWKALLAPLSVPHDPRNVCTNFGACSQNCTKRLIFVAKAPYYP